MSPAKDYKGAAPATTLVSSIVSGATSLTIASASGYPPGTVPFVIVVRRGTVTEEKMLVTRVGTAVTVATRGYDDTVASDHPAGAIVEHCLDAVTLKEANAHVNDDALDDHSQYLSVARHDLLARHPIAVVGLGLLGQAETTTPQGSITTEVDLANLTTPATVGVSRRIRITGGVYPTSTVADALVELYLKEGATYLQQAGVLLSVAGVGETLGISRLFAASAGVHTYKLAMRVFAGVGTNNAALAYPSFITVEDVGPA